MEGESPSGPGHLNSLPSFPASSQAVTGRARPGHTGKNHPRKRENPPGGGSVTRRTHVKLKRKHRCPPDVQIQIKINGELVIGPIMGEELAYIAKYGHGTLEPVDILETMPGRIDRVEFLIQYFPGKKL